MKEITVEMAAQSCQGILHGKEESRFLTICGITTDSRKVQDGFLFIPLKGENVDGHDFIPDVFGKKAVCTLTEKPLAPEYEPYILVQSTLQALQDIAEFYRSILDIKVVGITGSVGKTSTKEMIASVLAQKFNVLKTLGNFNSQIGLPFMVFRLEEEHEIAVLEMGISDFEEMHRLSKIARPDVCVITNIGFCHLENLGNREGVLKAKSEIFDYMQENATIILNGDDDLLCRVEEVRGVRPVFFGTEEKHNIYADEITSLGIRGVSCRIHNGEETFQVVIPLPGRHMVLNALAATAVGRQFHLTKEEIKKGIESVVPVSGRFRIIETEDFTIADDCYNANPVSMKASIDVLQSAQGRKVCILGDMFELGKEEEKLHADVGRYAVQKEIDVILCVGALSRAMADAALKENGISEVNYFTDQDELFQKLFGILKKGDTILVKASHGMHFEHVIDELEKFKINT